MSTRTKQWLLKVVSGPHQGAEMGVRSGKILIGSDDECDVVLHDVLVAPQHVEIEVTASGIMAAPLGGRVFVNGKRIKDARQTVPDFAFLSMGGSHLVIGPDNGNWPLLSAADVPDLEKEVESAPADEKKTEAPAHAEPTSPKAIGVSTAQPKPKDTRAVAMFGIVAGVLLLVGWFFVYQDYLGLDSKEPSKVTTDNRTPLDRARAVVEAMELKDTIRIEETAGRVSVAGYVDTEAKQRELQAAFRGAVPGLHTRLYSLEKIASTARSLLDGQYLPLTVSSLSEGKLKISGKIPSADPWVRMKQTLLRAVPGIGDIEDGVEIEAPLPVVAQAQPLALTSAAQPASTEPPPTESDHVTDYLVTSDTIDTPEATVATIKCSPETLSFLRLSTGGVYLVGARLPFGGRVADIEASTVTIEEKGTTRKLRQGDLVIMPKGSNAANSSVAPKS